MIETRISDRAKPDAVDFLRNSLIKRRIVSPYGRRRKYKIKDEGAFMQLFKAFFIIWIYNNFRFEGKSNFCFPRLNKKNTLLLLPPKNIISAYLNENNKSFYKNNIFEDIEAPISRSINTCVLSNFLNFNLAQFKKEGIDINHNCRGNCKYCLERHSKIIAKKIKDKSVLGFGLGGYPFLIHEASSDLIRDILKVYLAEAKTKTEISEPLSYLLLAFICIYLGSENRLGGGKTNCEIYLDTFENVANSPLKIKSYSNEIDAIIYSQQKKVLRAIELTTLYETAFSHSLSGTGKQFPDHFKKTINNFNILYHYANTRNINFKFVYLTLVDFSDNMKKTPEYYICQKNNSFVHLSINKEFEKLKSLAGTDNLTIEAINRFFNKLINRFKKHTKIT